MNTQVENMENSQIKITVDVDKEQVAKAVGEAYESMKKDFNVPGFRKGKIPRVAIEKMYGKEVFYNKAADILINNTLFKAVDENNIEMAAQVRSKDLEVLNMDENGMKYTALITVKPDITLGDYKNLPIEMEKAEILDDEIEDFIKREAQKNAREITIEDRSILPQDKVTIDFEGFVDDKPFEGGKGTDYELVVGSKTFIDNFEDQLIGKSIGENFDVNVTFPSEYPQKDLAGKPALFKVGIKGIKVSEIPEINDDFAADVSEFETLNEYKDDIRAKLLKDKETSNKSMAEQKAIENAVNNAGIKVPEAMTEDQINRNLRNFETRIRQQGISLDQYMQFTGQTMASLREALRKEAEDQIATRLVLEKIAELENIEVSDEDVDEELQQIANMYHMPFEDLKKSFKDYEKDSLVADIKLQKAAKVITDSAEILIK